MTVQQLSPVQIDVLANIKGRPLHALYSPWLLFDDGVLTSSVFSLLAGDNHYVVFENSWLESAESYDFWRLSVGAAETPKAISRNAKGDLVSPSTIRLPPRTTATGVRVFEAETGDQTVVRYDCAILFECNTGLLCIRARPDISDFIDCEFGEYGNDFVKNAVERIRL